MIKKEFFESLADEFVISAARSSGPGGQNVNKLNTKVEIRLDINKSTILTPKEKSLILTRLKNKINSNGELVVTSQKHRSQLKNRKEAINIMMKLISEALMEEKERKPTMPSDKSREERLEKKRLRAIIKKMRNEPDESAYE